MKKSLKSSFKIDLFRMFLNKTRNEKLFPFLVSILIILKSEPTTGRIERLSYPLIRCISIQFLLPYISVKQHNVSEFTNGHWIQNRISVVAYPDERCYSFFFDLSETIDFSVRIEHKVMLKPLTVVAGTGCNGNTTTTFKYLLRLFVDNIQLFRRSA